MNITENNVIIFTDGASKGNPGPGGWGAIVICNDNDSLKVSVRELGEREEHTTNNRMELTGAIQALKNISVKEKVILIYTDSSYLINGITKWVHGWQKNGWKKAQSNHNGKLEEVLNRDLWEELVTVTKNKDIKWNYVSGHVGIAGNERCDEIASDLAEKKKVKLFEGELKDYKIDILNIEKVEGKKKSKKSNTKVYSYVSLVNGVVYKDATWAECEKRVKGKSGVKYKKAFSPDEEEAILKSWVK